jgi:L-2-hydroxyglutarate oxidase LhgO
MAYRVDAIVVGAGVVGLACARRLALAGLETVVLESAYAIGQGISSRNSEVIHAGLYYRPGSLKARLCREGREQLYNYCEARSIPHRRVGKLVVACSDDQLGGLESIAETAGKNGCNDLQWLDASTAKSWEPALNCTAALYSPSTGIIDSHSLMMSFLGDAEAAGAVIAYGTPVLDGAVTESEIILKTGGAGTSEIGARYVVNAAGLEAPVVASGLAGFPKEHIPDRCYAKGSYFILSGRSPFSRLIYPIPEHGGLGIHLTLDLMGQARFGPDVEWISGPEYSVDAHKASRFMEAIRQYWPECPVERLQVGYAGVRPKLGSPESFADDFVIQCSATHRVTGLVNLLGIESPGLTSCMAIADEVLYRLCIHC